VKWTNAVQLERTDGTTIITLRAGLDNCSSERLAL